MNFEQWLMDCLKRVSELPKGIVECEIIQTPMGPLNLTKAMALAQEGELTLVPIRRGLTDIKLNQLLFDVLTDRGFKLNFLTGYYEPTTVRNAGAT